MKTECPYCGQHYEIQDEYNGVQAECIRCKKVFIIGPRWSPLLEKLTKEQFDAVTAQNGFIQVIGGPGTGKTQVLSWRLAYLIQELHIPAERILSITFTNTASLIIKKQVQQLVNTTDNIRVQTLLGFCNDILREKIGSLNYSPDYIIMDEKDRHEFIREIFREIGISSYVSSEKTLNIISASKANIDYVSLLTATSLDPLLEFPKDDVVSRIIKKYLKKQREYSFLDHNDLIMFVLYLFENKPEVLREWQEYFLYIQVDDFQDITDLQYQLITLLAQKHHNLFIVGDTNQTIYEWRNANPAHFINFPQQKLILLSHNFRLTPEIQEVANALLVHNSQSMESYQKSIKHNRSLPIYHLAKPEKPERDWITSEIIKLSSIYHFSDCAILCRTTYTMLNIIKALQQKSIPYCIFDDYSFYKKSEIKELLSFLRLVAYGDDISFLQTINIPIRRVSPRGIDFLKEYAQANRVPLLRALVENLDDKLFCKAVDFVEIIHDARRESDNGLCVSCILLNILKRIEYEVIMLEKGYMGCKDNIEKLIYSIRCMENENLGIITLQKYLEYIFLYFERRKQEENKVKVMTIHGAKGLEFPCVFVSGLNEGILPNSHAMTPHELLEERRIAYVAFTRAKERLFLSSDIDSHNYGPSMKHSRFIDEIKEFIQLS